MEDEERRTLIHEFHRIYSLLKERHDLRMTSSFGLYDEGFIDIWEYEHDMRTKRVCRVKGDNEEECYRRAISELEYMKQKEDMADEREQKAG